jgi:hypothetical protein
LRRCGLPVTTVFTNMLLRTIEQASRAGWRSQSSSRRPGYLPVRCDMLLRLTKERQVAIF